jgi:hypothetical protein
MGLYPHKTRRKRIETAVTAALLWFVIAGLFAFFMLGERRDGLEPQFGDVAYLVVIGVSGLIGLVIYVCGGRR